MSRHEVRAALVDLLQSAPALAGVQVTLVWPGDQTEDEAIYLLPSQGTLSVPVLHGPPSPSNPVTYEDNFTVPVEIRATKAGQDDTEAEVRIEELVWAVIGVVAADPSLGLGIPNAAGLMFATVSEYDGPGPGRGSAGVQAFARLTIDCIART